MTPPVWSGKKTAVAAALALGFSSIGAVGPAAAMPAGAASNSPGGRGFPGGGQFQPGGRTGPQGPPGGVLPGAPDDGGPYSGLGDGTSTT